jgi:sugar/nucleoside kinase (ribokinase family)
MSDTHEKSLDIIGIGAPVLDTLVQVDDAFLDQHVMGEKGGMEMLDASALEAILSETDGHLVHTPGGSAGNTIFAMARIGLKTSFIGKLGNDEAARIFLESYREMGGDVSRFKKADEPNARCLSMVTPDSERTMRTMLGASALLSPEEIHPEDFHGARHTHLEGYLFFNPELIQSLTATAAEAGTSISVDLASFEVVHAAGADLPALLEKYVDVVFANEEEAKAYFPEESDYESMARQLAEICKVAVVKLGAKGSIIASGSDVYHVDCIPAENLTDTTGAGDLWAAGFLSGWLQGKSLAECGRLGSLMGSEIVQVMGAKIPEERWPSLLPEFSKS